MRSNQSRLGGFAPAILVGLFLGCSSSDDKPSSGGAGGTGGAGGRPGSGGASATGGTTGAGGSAGATGSGGNTSQGGAGGGAGGGGTTPDAPRDGAVEVAPETAGVADAPADRVVADAGGDQATGAFKLTAPWPEGGTIPAQHACSMNNWPAITWTPGPSGTASYAFALHDNNYDTHYVILDIPATVTSLPPVPAATRVPKMGFATVNDMKWGGPCAPTGIHTYTLTVYALRTAMYQGAATSAPTVRRNLEMMSNADVLGRASYTGRQGSN